MTDVETLESQLIDSNRKADELLQRISRLASKEEAFAAASKELESTNGQLQGTLQELGNLIGEVRGFVASTAEVVGSLKEAKLHEVGESVQQTRAEVEQMRTFVAEECVGKLEGVQQRQARIGLWLGIGLLAVGGVAVATLVMLMLG